MNKKLLSLFGLKWNPFSPDVPTDALMVAPRIESFCWRVENLARKGGFALVTGAPGIGKSSALRLLVERLGAVREIKIGVMARSHVGVSDFYRELGDLFGVQLSPHNRWAGAEKIIAVDRVPYRLKMAVEQAGATDVINYEDMPLHEGWEGRGPQRTGQGQHVPRDPPARLGRRRRRE